MRASRRPDVDSVLSDEVSDNRHGRRRTLADTHGRSGAGHACEAAGSARLYLASDEEAAGSNPATPTSSEGI